MTELADSLDDAVQTAQTLLGWKLIHDTPQGLLSGRIVETEAYMSTDAASHTFKGPTPRTSVMFGPAGHAYIYFTYGMHYCFNVVTGPKGSGQGVLIRALEPLEGLDIMSENRVDRPINELTNGPAKLVQAMGISKDDYGTNLLNGGKLRLEPGPPNAKIIKATRIGISREQHKLWRFYLQDNPFVSKK